MLSIFRPSFAPFLALGMSLLPSALAAPHHHSGLSARAEGAIGSLCKKTEHAGALQVNAPQSSHGETPYLYPLKADDQGIISTASAEDGGDVFTFYNCGEQQYNDYYNVTTSYPDGFGLLQSQKQTSKCLAITQLPADTLAPISGNGTGFVPFHLADCPTLDSFSDLNNADTSAPIHYSWFSIGGISDKGVYEIDYKGNSTDPVPFVQGRAPVGSPAEAYYGFIGPQYGHLELKA